MGCIWNVIFAKPAVNSFYKTVISCSVGKCNIYNVAYSCNTAVVPAFWSWAQHSVHVLYPVYCIRQHIGQVSQIWYCHTALVISADYPGFDNKCFQPQWAQSHYCAIAQSGHLSNGFVQVFLVVLAVQLIAYRHYHFISSWRNAVFSHAYFCNVDKISQWSWFKLVSQIYRYSKYNIRVFYYVWLSNNCSERKCIRSRKNWV